MPLPQSLEVPKSTILFQSKAFKIGSVVQGEFAARQLLEMAERKVSAVTYATVVGVASTALQAQRQRNSAIGWRCDGHAYGLLIHTIESC